MLEQPIYWQYWQRHFWNLLWTWVHQLKICFKSEFNLQNNHEKHCLRWTAYLPSLPVAHVWLKGEGDTLGEVFNMEQGLRALECNPCESKRELKPFLWSAALFCDWHEEPCRLKGLEHSRSQSWILPCFLDSFKQPLRCWEDQTEVTFFMG